MYIFVTVLHIFVVINTDYGAMDDQWIRHLGPIRSWPPFTVL